MSISKRQYFKEKGIISYDIVLMNSLKKIGVFNYNPIYDFKGDLVL